MVPYVIYSMLCDRIFVGHVRIQGTNNKFIKTVSIQIQFELFYLKIIIRHF